MSEKKNYNSRYSVNSKKEILTSEDVYACNLLCFLLIYTISNNWCITSKNRIWRWCLSKRIQYNADVWKTFIIVLIWIDNQFRDLHSVCVCVCLSTCLSIYLEQPKLVRPGRSICSRYLLIDFVTVACALMM